MANQLPPDIEEGEILEQDLDLINNVETGNIEHDNPELYVQYVAPHAKNESNSHTFIGSSSRSNGHAAAADVRGYFRGRREIMNKWGEFERGRETPVDQQQKNYNYDLFAVDPTNDSTYSRVHSKNNGKRIQKHPYPVTFDGVAENIMSQIDEVMCRQNRPSTGRRKKRRAERELKYKLEKPHGDRRSSSYGPSHEGMDFNTKPGGGGGASRKRCDRCRHCSRGSSPEKSLSEDSSRPKLSGRKKRRRMKREEHSDEWMSVENDKSARFKSLRDFDEVRRDLLEKLKRKEGEKEGGMLKSGEYNDVASASAAVAPATERKRKQPSEMIMLESEGDEEMDVARLRLIALASKDNGSKSSRKGEVSLIDHSVVVTRDARSEEKGSDEADFDRNELLLRAEALKTALLKKHQKRLNNLKKGSGGPMTDITVRNSFSSSPPTPPSPRSAEMKQTKHIADVATETGGDVGEAVSRVNGNDSDVKHDEDDDGCKENVGSYCSGETTTTHSLNATSKRFADHGGIGNAVLKVRRKRIRSKAVMPSAERNAENAGEAVPNPASLSDSEPANENRSDRKPAKSMGSKNNFSNAKAQKSAEDPSALLKGINDLVAARSKSAGPSADSKAVENEYNALPSKALASVAVPKPDIQRIIVHLGSEDSSSDDEEVPVVAPAAAAAADDDTIAIKKEGRSSLVPSSPGGSNPGSITPATEDALKIREEKIMSLLGRTRLEIDRSLERAKKMKPIASAEAICKHLPPSQRLEYLRLKQKIAEREYLIKKSTKSSGAPAPGEKATSAGAGRGPVTGAGAGAVSRTQVPGPRVLGPSEPPPSARLLPGQTLISKLRFLLKKMKIEKTIEENYVKEIGRLKSQLTVLEKRKAEQVLKIRRLAEESLKTYKLIRGEGPPADGVLQRPDVASSQITAGGNVGVVTAKKEEEQSCPGGSSNSVMISEHSVAKEKGVGQSVPYNSPLEAFSRGSDAAVRLDPNAIMCQFDFTGVCRDEECAYQHVRST